MARAKAAVTMLGDPFRASPDDIKDRKLRSADLPWASLLHALNGAGWDLVRIGEVPPWMERCPNIPNPVFRLKKVTDGL